MIEAARWFMRMIATVFGFGKDAPDVPDYVCPDCDYIEGHAADCPHVQPPKTAPRKRAPAKALTSRKRPSAKLARRKKTTAKKTSAKPKRRTRPTK